MASEQPRSATGLPSSSPFGDKYHTLLLEQYKIYVESSNKISDRRGTAHTFLLTANTALVTVYSLSAGKDVRISAADTMWQILIPVAGLILALTWILLIRSYRTINGAKFAVILAMEEQLPLRCFGDEWTQLERLRAGRRGVELGIAEQLVPLTFATLYIALAIASLV